MAKFSSIKNTFQNGELSDKLVGRTDINEYGNGCKLLQNFIPLVSGGITKLPGSRYVKTTLPGGGDDPLDNIKRGLIPFTDVDGTGYIIELYRIDALNRGSGNAGDSIEITIRNTSGVKVGGSSVFPEYVGSFGDVSTGWEFNQIGTTLVIVHKSGFISPIYIVKIGSKFTVGSLLFSYFTGVPSVPRNYLRIPYGPQSFDANLIFKINTASAGAAVAQMVDAGSGPVKFFRSYVIPGGPWRLVNPYYVRVNSSSTSGIFKGGAAFAGDIAASDVNTGTGQITITGHDFSNGDEVQLVAGQYSIGGGPGTLPEPLVANTTYYVIVVDANTIQLAATEVDAGTGTEIALTTAGADYFNIFGTFTSKSRGTNLLAHPAAVTSGLFSWQLGQWSFDQGYPRVVTAFEQRLIFMGNAAYPDTVWNSRTGNIYHFMQTKLVQDASGESSGNNYFGAVESTDAFSYNPASSEVGTIVWASSQRNLFIGTDYSEFAISGVDGIYGPNSVEIRPQTYHGGTAIRAARQGNTTLFVTRDGKKVRDFKYSDNNGSNISRNLSILADQMHAHNFSSGDYNGINFVQTVWQEAAGTLWLLTSIGEVASLTLDDSGGVTAWARHDFNGVVHSMLAIPSSNRDWDDVWFLIQRGTKYYLEYISEPFEHPLLVNTSTTPSDIPVYLHSGVVVTNSPASTTVSGLDHLEGLEVYALADGVKVGPFTVASGEITLDTAAEKVVVGLSYTSKMITMPLEAGAVIGSSQNLLKRVDQVLFKLYKSLGGKYGFGDRLYDFEYGTVTAGQTFTGNLDQVLHSTNAKDYRVVVEHSDPYPFTLLSAVMRGVTQE